MLSTIDAMLDDFRCPATGAPLRKDGLSLVTADGAHRYPIVEDVPILVDFATSILDRSATIASGGGAVLERTKRHGLAARLRRLASPEAERTRTNLANLSSLLKQRSNKPRVLVVGGGTIGIGAEEFYDEKDFEIVAFDIYKSISIHFIADAHRIPLNDGGFDCVIVQAVLEHVLDPNQVVSEIWRVLKPDGIVYAETPFLQQVHEGPYDFTRFTESGHRYLFRRFDLIASGVVGGVGAQVIWTIDYFVRSLLRSRNAGKAAKFLFFWIKYIDKSIPSEYAIDGASGVFFMGRKTDTVIQPLEIVQHYKGADRRSKSAS